MLENRIERLERQNRRLQVLVTVAIMAGFLPWLSGSKGAVEDLIRAKSFALLDGDGGVRGEWSISKDGECKLVVTGSSEKDAPTAMLRGTKDGAVFAASRD